MKVPNKKKNTPEFVIGVVGLCNLFDCSPSTAWRYRRDWLEPAVTKHGKMIVTNVAVALSLWKEKIGG